MSYDNIIYLFDEEFDDENSEPNIINKLIHIKSSDSSLRLKIANKIKYLANIEIIYTEDENQINEEDYIIFGSNLSEKEIDKLNLIKSFKDDLKIFIFEADRLPKSQQISTDILKLLFFKTEVL